MDADRDSWTAYARDRGLLQAHPAANAGPPPAKPNKYRAQRIHIDGIWFDSKKEAARYAELKLQQAAGQIDQLELQPAFPLHVMEIYRNYGIRITTIGTYRADFRYCDLTTGEIITEDVKSPCTKTEAYQLRKRLAETIHGFTVQER